MVKMSYFYILKNTIKSLEVKEDKHNMSIFLSNNKFHMSMEYLMQNYRKWRNLRKWDHHRGVSRPPLWAHQPFQALMIYVKGSKVILHPRIKVVFALKGERSTHMY